MNHSFHLHQSDLLTIEWNWFESKTFITHALYTAYLLYGLSLSGCTKGIMLFIHSIAGRLVILIRPQSDFDELWLLIFDNFLSLFGIFLWCHNWKRMKILLHCCAQTNQFTCFFSRSFHAFISFKWSLDMLFDEWIKCRTLTMTQFAQWAGIHSCVMAKLLSVTRFLYDQIVSASQFVIEKMKQRQTESVCVWVRESQKNCICTK